MKSTISILILLLFANLNYAQQNIYLVGNIDGSNLQERLTQFEAAIKQEEGNNKFTLILLGDVKQSSTKNEFTLLSFIIKTKAAGNNVFSVTGDNDWYNAGYYGLDTVSLLQKTFKEKIGSNIFIPKKDCPGPYIEDIGDNIRLIGINSQWWLHPYRKVLPTDSECDNILKVQILDELNDAIETAKGRKVFIVTHHPISSGGVYGGNSNLKGQLFPFSHNDPDDKTFLPFYGTFHHCYRQNIGSEQDFSSTEYKQYIKDIENVLYNHQDVILCSSHEYDLQLLKVNNNYQVISGSFLKSAQVDNVENTLYSNKNTGFVKLEISPDREVISKFFILNKKSNQFVIDEILPLHNENHTHIFTNTIKAKESIKYTTNDSIIGGEYGASGFKQLFFGSLYRKAWIEPITVPILFLDTTFGGLTPLKKGGGLQTISLQFIDSVGRKYAFRSIDKTPAKALPIEFRINLVKDVTQDMTATQHPYGALFVAELLNATELYHGTPKLYIMPDSPKLDKYRNQFSGMFGMLEPKPTELSDLTKSYKNANDVKSTLSLFNKLYDSPKVTIDTLQFAKARIFDLFIGDWDRHQDNWKWIGFKNENNTNYKPYPKDRDHAFSQMNGLFYYLADRDWAVPFRENFNSKYTGIKSLTLKGTHLDRFLLASLDKEDWLKVTNELNTQITEQVIDNAKLAFPNELQEKSGKEIAEKLKVRKEGLNDAVEKYYKLLAKEVDVVGTNEAEYFEITRLESGAVNVKMYPRKDLSFDKLRMTVFFDRTFYPNETEEVRLFGLAEVDSFYISGNSKKSILVRIVGGNGVDIVNDQSNTKLGTRKTLVYDYPNGVNLRKSKETRAIYSEKSTLNEYNQEAFQYNTYLPVPLLVVNPDDGFGGGFVLNMKRFGYGNKEYKAAHTIHAFATTKGSSLFSLATERNIGRTNFYLTGKVDFGNSFPFYSYYGAGNNTVLIDSIKDAGLYKARYTGTILQGGSIYRFFNKSFIAVNGIGEFLKEGHSDESFFDVFPSPELQPKNAGGGEVKFDLDFRDSQTFTSKGIRITLAHKSLFTSSDAFGITSAEIGYYTTSNIGIPVTLGIKVGTERTYGKNIPYYHLASIGQSSHLRGFLQNRFSGVGVNYVNTDLRFHLGKTKSGFLPVYYGINAFGDIGQVVQKDSFTEQSWHNGYGGGIYLTPISKDYVTLQVNVEHSNEQNILFKIGLGVLL
jgi:hypothetical protein